DLAPEPKGLLEPRHAQGEHELRAEGERPLGADEGAAPGDVAGVVGKEGVEPLVAHLQLDGLALILPAVSLVAVTHVCSFRASRARARSCETTRAAHRGKGPGSGGLPPGKPPRRRRFRSGTCSGALAEDGHRLLWGGSWSRESGS